MKIGFIGAGKAGCSLGKYFEQTESDVQVIGYYSLMNEEAMWAAQFTNSKCFSDLEELIAQSDSIIISTPDGVIRSVWDSIDKSKVRGKVFCHLSGSLSSDVLSKCGEYGAYSISIHPLFAFSNKESVYQQLNRVSFTLEGDLYAVQLWQDFFSSIGNDVVVISKEVKTKYHAAASVLSNHVVAVLSMGYELLMSCGFSEKEARDFSRVLVQENVEHVMTDGVVMALTGPIERGDCETVEKHLAVLESKDAELYKACGKKLVEIAKCKNPNRNYDDICRRLNE